MKILVVAGYCLRVNSSANLCHLSYIRGLLENGYSVDLLTVSEDGQKIDRGIHIPKVNQCSTYKCSLYERLSNRRGGGAGAAGGAAAASQEVPARVGWKSSLKRKLRAAYGPHGMSIMWYHHAKAFKSKECYDLVISLSDPTVSHKLVSWLLKKGRLKAKRWIQIWEDPWSGDICYNEKMAHVKEEEETLLDEAEQVLYVSPLTLLNQKKLFPRSAHKMGWMPLPSYYGSELKEEDFSRLTFGYFGDYASHVRNLKPFYDAAVELGLQVRICGNSDLSLISTDTVRVFPRLPLGELKTHEDAANVLVFLCNLRGGQIPGKIYQYSATNKAVLFILDGTEDEVRTLKAYFGKFDRYIFCENTPESIKEAVAALQSGTLGEHLRRPIEYFAPRDIVRRIVEGSP